MKGGTIIVGGDTGAFSGFMMQRGRMVVLWQRRQEPGRFSMYDGTIYVGGEIQRSLGVDAVARRIDDLDKAWLTRKLTQYGLEPEKGVRSLHQDRRGQAALELRQPGAEREEEFAVILGLPEEP